MPPGGTNLDEDSRYDQRRAKPQREARWLRSYAIDKLNLPQKKTESGDYESKAHEREAGANPREKGTLDGQVVAQIGFGLHRGIIRRPDQGRPATGFQEHSA